MALSRTFLIALVVGTLMLVTFIWMYYLYRRRLLLQMRGTASATPAPATTTLQTVTIQPDPRLMHYQGQNAAPAAYPNGFPPAPPPQNFAAPTNASALSDGPPSYTQAISAGPVPQPPSYEDAVRK